MSDSRRKIRVFLCIASAVLLMIGSVLAAPVQASSKPYRVLRNIGEHLDEYLEEDTSDADGTLYGVIPAKYRSKAVTSVKNQGNYGTCNYFAILAATESSAIKNRIKIKGKRATKKLNLSEAHLLYFIFHRKADSFGGTKGDKVSVKNGSYLYSGGNLPTSVFHLMTWSGPVSEKTAPYSRISSRVAASKAYKNVLHVQGFKIYALSESARVKRAVMSYGAAAIPYYHNEWYLNEDTGAYYNPTVDTPNHAVCIVGWDDHYSRKNFTDKPSKDGAWLCKNQWGTGWGSKGYFWLSYEDVCISSRNAAITVDVASSKKYDYNYQYDGGAVFDGLTAKGTKFTAANVFTVKGASRQKLAAISVATFTRNVKYSVQIYKSPRKGKPLSGTKMLKKEQTGTIRDYGYTTIPLNKPVSLKKGDTFTVAVTLRSPNHPAILTDSSGDAVSGVISSRTSQKKGQSYLIVNSNTYDLAGEGMTVRMKAYTVK